MIIKFAKVTAETGMSSRDVDVPDGATVGQVLAAAEEEVGRNMALAVNGMVTTDPDTVVAEGSVVTLTSQIKGG